MEVASFAREVAHGAAEHAASYRLGQAALRRLVRALGVYENCARWAVPPPLDSEERPQAELVRPLPWPLFLLTLLILRVARELISLLNLARGRPPLRSADVVVFFQSKRRYLRTLKYQGSRMMRARGGGAGWCGGVLGLARRGLCLSAPANNNTLSHDDEVVVVSGGQPRAGSPPADSMERLIDKMMADLDAASDEDSNHTLTNTTGVRSESHDTTLRNDATPTRQNGESALNGSDLHFSPGNDTSTPEKVVQNNRVEKTQIESEDKSTNQEAANEQSPQQVSEVLESTGADVTSVTPQAPGNHVGERDTKDTKMQAEDKTSKQEGPLSQPAGDVSQAGERDNTPKKETNIQAESPRQEVVQESKQVNKVEQESALKPAPARPASANHVGERDNTPKKEIKLPNGRASKSVPNKKKGQLRERLSSTETSPAKVLTATNSF